MNIIQDAGGRKFILCVLLMIIFTIFVVMSKMTVDQFLVAVLGNFGIFATANVATKAVSVKSQENGTEN